MRSEETNLANLIADIVRTEHDNVDLSLLNCGTLRYNSVIPRGEITGRMIANLLPQSDKVVVLRMPGRIVHAMIENAVSAYPKLDGRFAAISGLKFKFDAN